MNNTNALKWIGANSKKEVPGLVSLVLCDALYSVCSVSMAWFAKKIIDFAQNGAKQELIRYAAVLLGVIVFQIVLKLSSKAIEVRVSGRLEMRYKTSLFSNILEKDFLKISRYHSGELMTRLTSDIGIISQAVVSIVPNVVSTVTRLVCAFAVLFFLDKTFAVLFLAAGIVLFVFTRVFRGSMKKLHRAVQETDGKVRSFMQEAVESVLVVKIFGVNKKMKKEAEDLQHENYYAKIRNNRWSIFAYLGFSAAFSFGYLLRLCGVR